MRSIKLFVIAIMLCTFLPALSFASETEDAVKTPVIKNELAAKYEKAMTALADKDFKKACDILIPLASRDCDATSDEVDRNSILAAKTMLGLLYFKGDGVDQDVVKGMSMIMDAAKKGYQPAKANAVALTGELAALGEPVAMYNAGYMCLNGWGGEQDPNTCVALIEKAAEGGHEKSAKFLASIYTKGKYGITPDKEKADHYGSLIQQ